jgi:SAM-dependent methyltransferase
VDRCAQVLQIARDCLPPQIELHCADAREWLAVTRASFDRILLFHVLEHMPVEAAAALLEVARHHLLPAGAVVIEVPNMSSVMAGNTFWSDITHVRGYTEYSLGQLLDLAGYPHWETVCRPPRPFARGLVTGRRSGTSLGWWLNRLLHLGLYRVCVSGPMPRCFCPALLMLAYAG